MRESDYKSQQPIFDIGNDLSECGTTEKKIKRALVSYLTLPFRLSPDDPRNLQFSNIGIARSIVKALNHLGYTVDLVDWTNQRFLPTRKYELFLGHGGLNFKRICCSLRGDPTIIYLSTGSYWKFHNKKTLARTKDLCRRRKTKIFPDRLVSRAEEWANRKADVIICIGNEETKKTYHKFPRVFNLNNAAYSDTHFLQKEKNYSEARNHFLFFPGGGNIHKGLDLLLEAFIQTEAHLYICQDIREDFYRIYRRELENFSNIHRIGWIPVRSEIFYSLIEKCAFVINPSCCEGQPGGVIECMHQGLIPIVSKESHLDVGDAGLVLKETSVAEIVRTIGDLSRMEPEVCKVMSQKAYNLAGREFSEEKFLTNLKKIILSFL